MIKIPGKIPIYIHPTFWLFAGLIGYLSGGGWIGVLIWLGIIFVSVLFHELGHALTAFAFGRKPRIELVALGGLTYYDGQKLRFWKQFLIVFNGPLFGFILFLVASWSLRFPSVAQGGWGPVLVLLQMANLFWTVLNLLPILPLDGGQLLRLILEKWWGVRGIRYALITSIVLALSMSVFFLSRQSLIGGALFLLLAFQSGDLLRKLRYVSEQDQDDGLKTLLKRVEEKLEAGHKEEAMTLLIEIRKKVSEGVIFQLATQYLAWMQYEAGHLKEAYQLLLPLKEQLTQDTLCLLHRIAFELKDFPVVVQLAAGCYQVLPTVDTAVRNASAHAALAQTTATVGWLETAIQEGIQNLHEVLSDPHFDGVRKDPSFQQWMASLPEEGRDAP